MKIFDAIETLAAGGIAAGAEPAGAGRAALAGYSAGALGVFVFLRLFQAVPGGFFSYLALLLLLLALNFAAAALTHQFLALTGEAGSAGRLFRAFGYSDYLLALLVPAGLFVKLGLLGAWAAYLLFMLGLFALRAAAVRKLYPVSFNKAALAVALPYAGAGAFAVYSFSLLTGWLIWLAL